MENKGSSGSLQVDYSTNFLKKRRKATVPGLVDDEDDVVYGSTVITKVAG